MTEEEVTIEPEDVGEMPAELLEEVADAAEAEEEDSEEAAVVEEEVQAAVEAEEEEVAEGAAPNEPDPPDQEGTPGVDVDYPGIVTALSPVAHAKLQEIWAANGRPKGFNYQGSRWTAYGIKGEKFVRTGGEGSMDQFYGSLSVG